MRLRRSAALSVLLVPLVVGALPLPAAPAPSARPVPPAVRSVEVPTPDPAGVGAGVTARAGTPAAPEQPVAESDPVETDGFLVVGATWARGSAVEGTTAQLRTRVGERWSAWQDMPVDDEHGPDGAEAVAARDGSEPMVVGDVDAVQVRLRAPGGRAPHGVRLEVVDARRAAYDTRAGTTASGTARAATARPTIHSRAEWGADERIRTGGVEYGEVGAGFVHHTVNANSYTAADVPAIIRGIYAFHVKGRGWKDIGYNFLVDRFGRIWEGRYGGVDLPVVGAHTAGYNDDAFAMSAIGDFTSVTPSDAVLDAYGRLFAWKLSLHGVDPTATTRLDGTSFRTVSGHRDAAATACPGQRLYDRLPAIRTLAKSHQASFAGRDPQRVAAPNGAPDLAGLNSGGTRLLLSPGDGGRGFLASRRVGTGWGGLGVTGPGDWDGDGRTDVLAVDPSTGTLWLYPGNGRGDWQARRAVGSGWTDMRHVAGPGDLDGDGRRDLLAVDPGGRLWLYPGNGSGGFFPRRAVGPGWQVMDMLVAPGDWNGDGRADLLAREAASGALWLYPGTGGGGFKSRTQIGSGWGGMSRVVGPGDWDGDRRVDLLAFDRTGDAWLYPRTVSGAFSARARVGSGWSSMDAVLAVGDWDGDGPADLMARSAAGGQLHLYPGSGGRRFGPGVTASPPGVAADTALLVGDWSGDGRPDVLGRAAVGGALYLWTGLGDGSFTAPRAVGSAWQGFTSLTAAGDWDGDGRPDLLAFDRASGVLWQYRADGRGGFLTRRQIGSGLARFDMVVGVGRWDGDGAPDVVAREAATGALHLFPGNGPGGLLAGRVVGSGWQVMDAVVGVGDADGDGRADVVARERGTGRLWLYPGNGSGGFRARSLLGGEWASWAGLG